MTRYQKGYRIELKAKLALQLEGYTVFRTAGSHSLFDLIAVNKDEVRLIQLKSTKGKPYYKKEILGIKRFKNYPAPVTKEFWVWRDRSGWIKEIIK